jgi:hypothetical protein
MFRHALAIAAAVIFLWPQLSFAGELDQIKIAKVATQGEFQPDADKSYLLVESRNSRPPPLIRFVRLADSSNDRNLIIPSGYIEIPQQQRLANSGKTSLWLFEIPSGDYVFSNIEWMIIVKDCACMGSVRFAVPRGKVTAVRVETAALDAQGRQIDVGSIASGHGEQDAWAKRGISIGHPTSGLWQGRINPTALVPAHFIPIPELPNWFGYQVNRVMPVAGVLDYERERMVDLRR